MLIIPGILASQRIAAGDYESIATVTVGSGGAANVEFTSIPATYKHLQVRYFSRSTATEVTNALYVQVNGATGNVYSYHTLSGNGTSASASGGGTVNVSYSLNAGASATSSVFGVGIFDLLDYENTNKYKTIRILSGIDNNGSGSVGLFSGSYQNTSAVTSLKFFANSGNIAQYSHFALYGVKG